MKIAFFRALTTGIVLAALYPIFVSKAWADDWGCQVILCLSNPGGPTQYAECRPPIERLWSHLRLGRSFPICSGVGFTATRPSYEPYYCNDGYQLIGQYGFDRGREVACLSNDRREVDRIYCNSEDGSTTHPGYVGLGMERVDGRLVCRAQTIESPNVRSRPRFIDVTIDGVGRQRVWF